MKWDAPMHVVIRRLHHHHVLQNVAIVIGSMGKEWDVYRRMLHIKWLILNRLDTYYILITKIKGAILVMMVIFICDYFALFLL